MELVQVEDSGTVRRLMGDPIVVPAHSRRQSDCGSYFPFILEVRHDEIASQPVAAPWSDVAELCKLSLDHTVRAKSQSIVRSLTLIQPDAAVLHSHLESVLAAAPDQIVDRAIGRADLDVGSVVIQPNEKIRANGERKGAGLRIMKWLAIDVHLGFIEEIWLESVL